LYDFKDMRIIPTQYKIRSYCQPAGILIWNRGKFLAMGMTGRRLCSIVRRTHLNWTVLAGLARGRWNGLAFSNWSNWCPLVLIIARIIIWSSQDLNSMGHCSMCKVRVLVCLLDCRSWWRSAEINGTDSRLVCPTPDQHLGRQRQFPRDSSPHEMHSIIHLAPTWETAAEQPLAEGWQLHQKVMTLWISQHANWSDQINPCILHILQSIQ
jgi:hypothetical protein